MGQEGRGREEKEKQGRGGGEKGREGGRVFTRYTSLYEPIRHMAVLRQLNQPKTTSRGLRMRNRKQKYVRTRGRHRRDVKRHFCPIARIFTPTPITPSAFFYIRCSLVHVTFSTPSWYTEYLFGTFLANYNDFWSFSVRLG